MDTPGDVGLDGVHALVDHLSESILPIIGMSTIVVEGAAHVAEGLAVLEEGLVVVGEGALGENNRSKEEESNECEFHGKHVYRIDSLLRMGLEERIMLCRIGMERRYTVCITKKYMDPR